MTALTTGVGASISPIALNSLIGEPARARLHPAGLEQTMVETGWGCFSQLVEPGKRARSGGEARCCSSKSMRRLVAPRTRGSEQNPRHLLGLYRQWRTDPDFPRQPNEPRRHRPAVRSGAETDEGPEVWRRERLRN